MSTTDSQIKLDSHSGGNKGATAPHGFLRRASRMKG